MPSTCKAFYCLQNIFTNRVWLSHLLQNAGERRKPPVLGPGASIRGLSLVFSLPFAAASQQWGPSKTFAKRAESSIFHPSVSYEFFLLLGTRSAWRRGQ